jgi:hypothetical protein
MIGRPRSMDALTFGSWTRTLLPAAKWNRCLFLAIERDSHIAFRPLLLVGSRGKFNPAARLFQSLRCCRRLTERLPHIHRTAKRIRTKGCIAFSSLYISRTPALPKIHSSMSTVVGLRLPWATALGQTGDSGVHNLDLVPHLVGAG